MSEDGPANIPVAIALKVYSRPLFLAERELRRRRGDRYGAIRELAKLMGISKASLYKSIKLQQPLSLAWRLKHWDRVCEVLLDLTGRLWNVDEVFPALSKRDAAVLSTERVLYADTSLPSLAALRGAGGIPALPPAPDEALEAKEMLEMMQRAVHSLTPREEEVIKMHFGLDGYEQRNLEEIAEQFNLSRETIRVTEAKALRKLRHPSRAKKLKPFLEAIR